MLKTDKVLLPNRFHTHWVVQLEISFRSYVECICSDLWSDSSGILYISDSVTVYSYNEVKGPDCDVFPRDKIKENDFSDWK